MPKTIKKTTKKEVAEEKKGVHAWVIRNPRLTEKAAHIGSSGIYTFDVSPDANKIQIKKAVEEQYKIKPLRVNVAISKPENRMFRGHKATVGGGEKKAMVFLRKGDTINLA